VDPNGDWIARLRLLHKEDVRTPQEEYDPDEKKNKKKESRKTKDSALKLGEGFKRTAVSWIWRVSSHQRSDADDGSDDGERELGDGKLPSLPFYLKLT
jgi:hypothetical protein